MVNIDEMAMGDYKKCIRDDVGSVLVHPTVPANATFELKGHILIALKDIPFYKKDHEDAFKHLDGVNNIADYFNTPNIPRETALLRMLPVTLKGAAKAWLKALPPGTITTWAQLRERFLNQFCPPSKISKLKKAIANFEQNLGESLYEASERYKGLLRNYPQHDLNIQQEMLIFYDEVNVMARQLLDSQGPLTKKNLNQAKELIEEFSRHSREYHNPGRDGIKGSGGTQTEEMGVVTAMISTMDRRLTQLDQSIHVIRVGCERCSGPHLTKDCKMDEYGNKKAQVCNSSGDKQTGRGFYQREQPLVEKKSELETMLMKFMEASEKRHDATEAAMEEQRNIPKNPENKTQSHVIAIDIEEEAISEFLEALQVEPQQPDPKQKKQKLEIEESVGTLSSRREPAMLTSWAQSEQKKSVSVPAYEPPLPFPSRANLSPLEREHLEFIKQLKGIPINTPFIDSLAKIPEYAKFLQYLLDTRQQLKENFKFILSEQSSKAVLGEIPKKMGDPGRLTLPCEFENNMKATKVTIHMANRSVTQPRRNVEDILVKIRKFIFPINFVVLHMKEDPNVAIILGRPLLNTVGALIDIRESKLTLRVGDEKEIFGIKYGFQGNHAQEEVFNIDEENELEELEKLMEEEIKTIQQVKRTKTRPFIPFLVEVIAYTNPTSWVSKEDDEMTSDEEEVTSKMTSPVVKEEKDTMEYKYEDNIETKGTKRKLDGDEVKAKKENSKKAYKRRVQAYKWRFKEQKILVVDSSDDST
ncbi:hypothetical protein Lser_V15G29447 [Lactuca serriola]